QISGGRGSSVRSMDRGIRRRRSSRKLLSQGGPERLHWGMIPAEGSPRALDPSPLSAQQDSLALSVAPWLGLVNLPVDRLDKHTFKLYQKLPFLAQSDIIG